MADVFVYMFFVGFGISFGIAITVLLSFLVYRRINRGNKKRRSK